MWLNFLEERKIASNPKIVLLRIFIVQLLMRFQHLFTWQTT